MKSTSSDQRKSTSHRLAIVEGHLKKVRAMVNQGSQCMEVIHQSRAIQQALKKFDEHVLQEHIRTCVSRDMKTNGVTSEKAIQQLVEAFKQL